MYGADEEGALAHLLYLVRMLLQFHTGAVVVASGTVDLIHWEAFPSVGREEEGDMLGIRLGRPLLQSSFLAFLCCGHDVAAVEICYQQISQ